MQFKRHQTRSSDAPNVAYSTIKSKQISLRATEGADKGTYKLLRAQSSADDKAVERLYGDKLSELNRRVLMKVRVKDALRADLKGVQQFTQE